MMRVELIVLYSHRCPVCNLMLPIMEEIEKDYVKNVCVKWIDADREPEVYEEFEIQLVPTFILQVDGEEVLRMVGMVGESEFRKRIEKWTKGE